MALDPRFVLGPSLQMYFVDKDTAFPLADGKVYFYKDSARTIPKSVYKITGTPPNYTYVDLGNVINLSSVGTFTDNLGNDILPYYFPYDGTPDDTLDNTELYYVVVTDVNGIDQFTREGWPNVREGGSAESGLINFIPNGQFLLHNDLPETIDYDTGEIRQGVTDIAQGGWRFVRPANSTARDLVTFPQITSYVEKPTANPRYFFKLTTESAGSGDSYKDLRCRFENVNKFASEEQEYTFAIEGQSNTGSGVEVSFVLIKNFGTGGSATIERTLATFTLPTSVSILQKTFIFGSNTDKTIGSLDDDYLELAIRFQPNTVQELSITNAFLCFGGVTITGFPATTDKDFVDRSLVPPVPAHNGNDLGLPMLPTLAGVEYDHDVVGDITSSILSAKKWHHFCDGSQLKFSEYTSTGVPNSRLGNKLIKPINSFSFEMPKYGTGDNFITCVPGSVAAELVIHTNTAGITTATSDGAVPTTFTFKQFHVGAAEILSKSLVLYENTGEATNKFWILNKNVGVVTDATTGNSGFTLTTIREGTALLKQIIQFATVVPASLAGKYFKFHTTGAEYYVWYKVAGVGTDPAAGGTGILVDLETADTDKLVAIKTSIAINEFEGTLITTKAASDITAGAYFNVYSGGATPKHYYVWYKKDSVGTDPNISGAIGIPVSIAGTATAEAVRNATGSAINQTYFKIPDARGMSLRGLDPNKTYDNDTRFGFGNAIGGMEIGTYQLDSNLSHRHKLHTYHEYTTGQPHKYAYPADDFEPTEEATVETELEGGASSHPYNMAVNFFIHY